jgi:hypothetical protein
MSGLEKPQVSDAVKTAETTKVEESPFSQKNIHKKLGEEPKSVKDITSQYLKKSPELKSYSDKKGEELKVLLE